MLWARGDGGLPARVPPRVPPGGLRPGAPPRDTLCTEALLRDLRALKARWGSKGTGGAKAPKGVSCPRGCVVIPRGLLPRALATAPLCHAYARWRGRRVSPAPCSR